MGFKVTNALRKLAKLEKRKKVIQGGTSAGKTFCILALLIDRCTKEEGLEISVVSESIPHLRRGALKDFLKIMMETNRYIDSHFNKSTLKYTFATKSFIEFFSVDQPDKLRGARRNVLFVNEANNIHFEAYNQMAIRTSGDIWLDFNPTSTFWAHTEVLKEDDSDFIILTYKDNDALHQNIVNDIEKAQYREGTYWENWWKVYGLGEVGRLEGVCIPEWEYIELPEEARLLCYGMDFGYSNDPTTLVGMYKYNDGYIFDEVIYQKGLLNSDISNLLRTHDIKEYVYADSAEPKSIAELQKYGHRVLPVSKGRDSIVYGINLLNQNKVFITSRSKNLINELQNYTWLKDKDGTTLNKPIDAFNHAIDAMRYAAMEQLQDPNKGKYFVY
jgi:phage terminase large subunit